MMKRLHITKQHKPVFLSNEAEAALNKVVDAELEVIKKLATSIAEARGHKAIEATDVKEAIKIRGHP